MQYIPNIKLYYKWLPIQKHLNVDTHQLDISRQNMLIVNKQFLLAANKSKMRLCSYLDWVHYTPKKLATAINTNQVEDYYWNQMGDVKSDPNVWKRSVEETTLKTYYANRAGRVYP